MSAATRYIEGELHVALETVAELYRVESVWLRRAYDRGILGGGVASEGGPWVAATRLDAIAVVVRLHVVLEMDLESIALFLESGADSGR